MSCKRQFLLFVNEHNLLETHDGFGTSIIRITIIHPIIDRYQRWALYGSWFIIQGYLCKDIASITGCFRKKIIILIQRSISDARATLGFLAEKDEKRLVAEQETLQNYQDQFSAWKNAVDSRQDISTLVTKIDDKSNEHEKTNLMIQFYADVCIQIQYWNMILTTTFICYRMKPN